MTEHSTVRERNRADRTRRLFSVLCDRGWCDYEFKIRDVAAIASMWTGRVRSEEDLPRHLPKRECPVPEICQCVCHDSGREQKPVAATATT